MPGEDLTGRLEDLAIEFGESSTVEPIDAVENGGLGQLAVDPRCGYEQLRRAVHERAGSDGKKVGQGAAKALVLAGREGVSPDIDERDVVGVEVLGGGRDLARHADTAVGGASRSGRAGSSAASRGSVEPAGGIGSAVGRISST